MRFDDLTVHELLASVAAKTPTPGGGAVASITAALAAALARMVVNYSVGRKSLASHDQLHQQSLRSLEQAGHTAMELAEADATAYARLNELWKLDQADARRVREFPSAVRDAIDAPMSVLALCVDMLQTLQQLAGTTNAMLKSDLAIAAVLAEAAARSAAWNVRINLPLVENASEAQALRDRMVALVGDAQSKAGAIEQACG